jgi:AraC-like DNA-binding protein
MVTISAGNFGRVISVGEQLGIAPQRLSQLCDGISDQLALPEGRVPIRRMHELLEEVMFSARDPALPITLAGGLGCTDLGLVGFAVLTAGAGSSILNCIHRFFPIVSQWGTWQVREGSEGTLVSYETPSSGSLGERIEVEKVLAHFVSATRDAVPGVVPVNVRFKHRAPREVAAHRAHFSCPIEFAAGEDGVLLPRGCQELVPRRSEPALFQYLLEQAEARLARLRCEPTLVERLKTQILAELVAGTVALPHIARRLGMSERTLRRRLEQENRSFRTLVDEARQCRAEQLLRANRSVTEVAHELGFSESSAFSRAFRRWRGQPPQQFRTHRGSDVVLPQS